MMYLRKNKPDQPSNNIFQYTKKKNILQNFMEQNHKRKHKQTILLTFPFKKMYLGNKKKEALRLFY